MIQGIFYRNRISPSLELDFTAAVADARVATARLNNTATRFNSSGVIEVVNANLPRFDYSPTTLACLGQLIEESRTNLFLNSLINGTNLTTQIVTLSAVAYTMSFYGSGSITISGGHSATVAGTGDFPSRRTYTFTPTAGISTFTVSGDVKFSNLEAGSIATSFIPTAATSVLRSADAVTMSGTNFSSWYNPSQGTIVATFSTTNTSGNGLETRAASGNTDFIRVARSGTTGYVRIFSGSVQQVEVFPPISGSWSDGVTIAVAYKANDFAAVASANLLRTDAIGAVPLNPTNMNIGSSAAGGHINGHMKAIEYYGKRALNDYLQVLSSIAGYRSIISPVTLDVIIS